MPWDERVLLQLWSGGLTALRVKADEVAEIRSLDATLARWRPEILNHHRTGASNGPTEGLNLCVKKVKRGG